MSTQHLHGSISILLSSNALNILHFSLYKTSVAIFILRPSYNKLTENGLPMKFSVVISSLFWIVSLLAPAFATLQDVESFQSCLIDHGVNNFTVYYKNPSTSYFNLLDFSIQNLRFLDPSIPKPLAIVVPESKEQLISSVLCSRAGSYEVRVRCGGHSYEGTSYTPSDGASFVLIDMMNLSQISVDLESEVAWVEGGATLGQTYYSISKSSSVHGFSGGIQLSPYLHRLYALQK